MSTDSIQMHTASGAPTDDAELATTSEVVVEVGDEGDEMFMLAAPTDLWQPDADE